MTGTGVHHHATATGLKHAADATQGARDGAVGLAVLLLDVRAIKFGIGTTESEMVGRLHFFQNFWLITTDQKMVYIDRRRSRSRSKDRYRRDDRRPGDRKHDRRDDRRDDKRDGRRDDRRERERDGTSKYGAFTWPLQALILS